MANRKSWWRTILRFFGFLSEGANDAMDKAVDVEIKLKRKVIELNEKKHEIENNPKLAKAIGLAEQLDGDLIRKNKAYARNKYDQTISQLMKANNKEQARRVLLQKKQDKDDIEATKEMLKTATATKERIQSDLEILDTNIRKVTGDLEALKQRNRFAEQSNEVYSLMTEIESISVGNDTEGIADEIRDREMEAHGRRSEYERRNVTAAATRNANNADLDAELENYR